jgi:hypothetical protein
MMDDHMSRPIAVIQGAPGSQAQDMLRHLVGRWKQTARIAGVIEEDHGLGERTCSAGRLSSIGDGRSYPIFQDLGPGVEACHLDGAGAVSASEAVRRDIAAGCDLVVLSKFGKLEAGGGGLAPAFTAAMQAGVPILTSVSPEFESAWARFAAPGFVVLPPQPDRIEAWWDAIAS